MHIEITIPELNHTNAQITSITIIREAFLRWAMDNPRATYHIHIADNRATVTFDQPKWITHWAMTWDRYRGNYHSTSWKRIQIINTK